MPKEKTLAFLTILNTTILVICLVLGSSIFLITKGFIFQVLVPKLNSNLEAEVFKSKFVSYLNSLKDMTLLDH